MTTSFNFELRRGSAIIGKWSRGHYRVERLLGEGANGRVYLVQRDRQWLALKIGGNTVDLQSEVNALKALERLKERGAEPYLYEVDDLLGPDGKEYPFYSMRYVRGETLGDYLQRQGMDWFPLAGLNLLGKLARLHEAGWVFGDLKVENVLVADYGHVELIDFGGTTATGKSVRQFTEMYDRGYWNSGSRSADPQYDLFSFGVLCIQLHAPARLKELSRQLLPQNRSAAELMGIVREVPSLKPLAGWLEGALGGGFPTAAEGAQAWRGLMRKQETSTASTPGWLKGLVATSGLLLAASICWLLWNG